MEKSTARTRLGPLILPCEVITKDGWWIASPQEVRINKTIVRIDTIQWNKAQYCEVPIHMNGLGHKCGYGVLRIDSQGHTIQLLCNCQEELTFFKEVRGGRARRSRGDVVET